jgi:hypothetical protein
MILTFFFTPFSFTVRGKTKKVVPLMADQKQGNYLRAFYQNSVRKVNYIASFPPGRGEEKESPGMNSCELFFLTHDDTNFGARHEKGTLLCWSVNGSHFPYDGVSVKIVAGVDVRDGENPFQVFSLSLYGFGV